MAIVNKDEYPEVFFLDEQMREEDKDFFATVLSVEMPAEEKLFFERMKEKVEGEFAPSADLIMSEKENNDEIFIVRYYFHEFKIGRHNSGDEIYEDSFLSFVSADLFPVLGRHITLIDWLRETAFKGVDYDGNSILKG